MKAAEISTEKDENSNVHIFFPNTQRYYSLKDLLTITNENGTRTLRVSEWLREDPVSFDIVRRETPIKVNKEVLNLLISKLKVYHPNYYKDALGLKTTIEFKGYDKPVQASVPYSNQPVEFYKWWCSNQDCVKMTFEEKIKLFDKVYLINPKILKREHLKLLKKM